MSVKQDRTGVRTAAQLEQKYSFGKKFSEILGLIDDSRDKVDSAMSELRSEITKTSTELSRTTEAVTVQAEKITTIENDVDTLESSVTTLSEEVEMKVDASAVSIAVKKELANGVDRVETETGYVFDSDGLTISKSGEQMENVIDNTGMYVTRSGYEILTANDEGVNATNLHASTYLIIGADEGRSRFEDFGTNRTGCFWIG